MLKLFAFYAGLALLTLAAAGVAYTLAGAWAVARRRRTAQPQAAPVPTSVLKPLHGLDPNLKANLAALLAQDYDAPIQLILGVQDPESPALVVAAQLAREHPGADIEIVTDARLHGANRKVSNLINMAAHIRHDLVVIADADIAVNDGYLRALAADCAETGAGVVSCAYVGRAAAGLWSVLTAMGISYHFFPNVLIAAASGLAAPVMGSTIALRRPVLEDIGGFAPFADVLADDYEIGRAVAARGLKAKLSGAVVAHECAERSWAALFAQELRWAVTIRTINPIGHIGSILTHPVPLALGAGLLLGGWAWAGLAAAALGRLWLMRQVDQTVGARTGSLLLWPARDMISFAIFLYSLFARSVRWRGAQFKVTGQGKLSLN